MASTALVGALAVLLFVHLAHEAEWRRREREWSAERGRLLDRLMARSLAEYQAAAAPEPEPVEALSDAEEARIEAAQGGIWGEQAEQ